MQSVFFYLFAFLTLLCGVLVMAFSAPGRTEDEAATPDVLYVAAMGQLARHEAQALVPRAAPAALGILDRGPQEVHRQHVRGPAVPADEEADLVAERAARLRSREAARRSNGSRE